MSFKIDLGKTSPCFSLLNRRAVQKKRQPDDKSCNWLRFLQINLLKATNCRDKRDVIGVSTLQKKGQKRVVWVILAE